MRFGSWANGIKRAGFEPQRRMLGIPKSEKEVLEDFNTFKEKAQGRYFGETFYVQNGGLYSPDHLMERFQCKNWSALLMRFLDLSRTKMAIISVRQPQKPPVDAELFAELKAVWDRLGRQPTSKEFRRMSKVGLVHYQRRFGGWLKAVIQFCARTGYPVERMKSPETTRDGLLEEIRAIASRVGNPPVLDFAVYRRHGGTYSLSAFQHRFGSWKKALKLVGLKDGRSRQTFSNEEYFAELQRIWELLGRQPEVRELKQCGSKMSPQAFQERFGSWTKAIHAFCEDRNKKTSGENLSAKQSPLSESSPALVAQAKAQGEDSGQEGAKPGVQIHRTPRQPSSRLRWKVMVRDSFRCKCGRSPATHPRSHLINDARG